MTITKATVVMTESAVSNSAGNLMVMKIRSAENDIKDFGMANVAMAE